MGDHVVRVLVYGKGLTYIRVCIRLKMDMAQWISGPFPSAVGPGAACLRISGTLASRIAALPPQVR